jgi:hypothetical protein
MYAGGAGCRSLDEIEDGKARFARSLEVMLDVLNDAIELVRASHGG